MNPKSQTKTLRLAALSAVVGLAITAPKAGATSTFDFNLGNVGAGTYSGTSNVPGVQLLNLAGGFSTVVDHLNGGTPNTVGGTTFTETGVIGVVGYQDATGSGALTGGPLTYNNAGGLGTASNLYLGYVLTGAVTVGGQLLFTTGSATLFLTNSSAVNANTDNVVVPGTTEAIETFNLVPGTSGLVNLALGGIPTGAVSLNFRVANDITPGLFSIGGSSVDGFALDLANIIPSLNTNTPINPLCGPSGTAPNGVGSCQSADTTERLFFTEQGQLLIEVPEPGTLMLFSGGLFGLRLIARKRRKAAD